MSVCQSLTALLTQNPSRDSSASRRWWSGFVPSVWEPSEDVVAVSPGSIKGLGSCSGSRGQRVVPGKAQALPLLILPPFQKNLGMILRTVPQLKGDETSCPAYSSSSCSLSSPLPSPAQRGLPSQLAGKPGAEPTAVSSLRLATAMAAQGQARAAGEEPVKGSPYEWVLIGQ